jgi:hypothetical protein
MNTPGPPPLVSERGLISVHSGVERTKLLPVAVNTDDVAPAGTTATTATASSRAWAADMPGGWQRGLGGPCMAGSRVRRWVWRSFSRHELWARCSKQVRAQVG